MTTDREKQQIESMAAQMVEADFGDGATSSIQALDAYLAANPHQVGLYCDMAALWETIGALEEPASATATAVDPWWRRIPYGKIAAALLPLLVVAGLLATGAFDPSGDRDAPFELRTAAAERRIVVLADGSTVTLSARTSLSVSLGRDARRLTLADGEALFDVAHDPSRPFIVSAAGGEVTAIGTAFNIRVQDQGAVVTVIEGRVNVMAGRGMNRRRPLGLSQLASAGQQVSYGTTRLAGAPDAPQSYITPAARVDAPRVVEWSRGLLRFNGEPLSEVVEEVNRHSRHRIRVLDPALGETPIYGVLHLGDERGLISIIRDMGGLDEASLREKVRVERENDNGSSHAG